MLKSFIYVLGSVDGRPKKIGITRNLKIRIRAAQIYSPEHLKYFYSRDCEGVIGSFICEQLSHHILEHRRIRGEWFAVTADEAIEAIGLAHDLISTKSDPFSVGRLKISAVRQWKRLYPDESDFQLGSELERKIRRALRPGETVAEFLREAVDNEIALRELEIGGPSGGQMNASDGAEAFRWKSEGRAQRLT